MTDNSAGQSPGDITRALIADTPIELEPGTCGCGAAAVGSDCHYPECAVGLHVGKVGA
jgi:hypothetical protein